MSDTEQYHAGFEALEPCPFCGGAAQVETEHRSNRVVECTECGANVGAVDLERGYYMWNRRAKGEASTEPSAQLEADCEPTCGYIGADCNFPACKMNFVAAGALTDDVKTRYSAYVAKCQQGRIIPCTFADFQAEHARLIREVVAEDAKDAARLEVFIDWYLRGGSRSEVHLYGHMVPTTREIVLQWLDRGAIEAHKAGSGK
jgi:hypothetical protein